MAVIKQGGSGFPGAVSTTMGMRARKPPLCGTCRQRRPEEIYEIDANGAPICSTCSNGLSQEVMDDAGNGSGAGFGADQAG